jgi:hypothetical protein
VKTTNEKNKKQTSVLYVHIHILETPRFGLAYQCQVTTAITEEGAAVSCAYPQTSEEERQTHASQAVDWDAYVQYAARGRRGTRSRPWRREGGVSNPSGERRRDDQSTHHPPCRTCRIRPLERELAGLELDEGEEESVDPQVEVRMDRPDLGKAR